MTIAVVKDVVRDWRSYLAEFLGTLTFVMIASGLVLSEMFYGTLGLLGIAIGIGFSYAALVFMTAHLSYGFLNPAITFALWFAQKLDGTRAFFYILIQIVASFVAAGILLFIFGGEAKEFVLGAPIIGSDVSVEAALAIEAILTALLTFSIFAIMVDKDGPVSFGPLAIGLMLTSLTLFAYPLTGSAFNPVRALGPAVISGVYTNLVIWIIGPLVGGFFGFVYNWLFLRKSSGRR